MLTLERHSRLFHFDDSGFQTLPYVYRTLPAGRFYEETFLEYIRSRAKAGQYVDVGAHLGTHTLWFAGLCPATHVHAFEPVGRYADVIRRNVTANSLDDRVTVYQTGLSSARGQATNYLSPEHEVGRFGADGKGVTESFEVLPLDEVVHGAVAVIKIDVEGMEAEVLRGARRLLVEHQPLIFAEARSRADLNAIEEVLAPIGYHLTGRVFNASPTYEFSTEAPGVSGRFRAARARLWPLARRVRRFAANLRRKRTERS
jgi:FkbM family methyltransferase